MTQRQLSDNGRKSSKQIKRDADKALLDSLDRRLKVHEARAKKIRNRALMAMFAGLGLTLLIIFLIGERS